MIARGKSPGTAASNAIDRLELATDRASIVMIPASRESQVETFVDRLLGEEEARKLINILGVESISA